MHSGEIEEMAERPGGGQEVENSMHSEEIEEIAERPGGDRK